jgi:hypothetical protein
MNLPENNVAFEYNRQFGVEMLRAVKVKRGSWAIWSIPAGTR